MYPKINVFFFFLVYKIELVSFPPASHGCEGKLVYGGGQVGFLRCMDHARGVCVRVCVCVWWSVCVVFTTLANYYLLVHQLILTPNPGHGTNVTWVMWTSTVSHWT